MTNDDLINRVLRACDTLLQEAEDLIDKYPNMRELDDLQTALCSMYKLEEEWDEWEASEETEEVGKWVP